MKPIAQRPRNGSEPLNPNRHVGSVPTYSRRRFLMTSSGISGVALLLSGGCGSGGKKGDTNFPNPTPSPTPGTPNPTPSPDDPSSFELTSLPETQVLQSISRDEPTGSLRDQIYQHSQVIDDFSLGLNGPTIAWEELGTVVSLSSEGGSGRQTQSTSAGEDVFRALRFTLPALEEAYARVMNSLVLLDTAGYVGDVVTQKNNLKGTASVANPFWVLTMMQRHYYTLDVLASCIKSLQIAGLRQMMDAVLAAPTPLDQLLAYNVFAEAFNFWVVVTAIRIGVPVDPTWLLDLSEGVTSERLPQIINTVPSIVERLPLSPSFATDIDAFATTRQAVTPTPTPTEPQKIYGQVTKSSVSTFLESFYDRYKFAAGIGSTTVQVGSVKVRYPVSSIDAIRGDIKTYYPTFARDLDLIKTSLKDGAKSSLPGLARLQIGSFVKGIGVGVATDIALDKLTDFTASYVSNSIGGERGELAGCVVKAGVAGVKLGVTTTVAVGEIGSGVGIPLAAVQVLSVGSAVNDVREVLFEDGCYRTFENSFKSTLNSLTAGTALTAPDGSAPSPREIYTVTNPRAAESDQIRRTNVVQSGISIPPSDTPGGPTADQIAPEAGRAILTVTGRIVRSHANTLRNVGRATTTAVPRTFTNIQIAAAALILDYARRNDSVTVTRYNGSAISFNAADFAGLLRREAGTTTARVPAIKGVDLLCTGPGFLPKRSDGTTDLTTLAGLPALDPLPDTLGTGVTIGAE